MPRQDRKSGSRTPISAKLVADLLTRAGADRILTIDLHSGQIQGFFDIPVDHQPATSLFVEDIQKNFSPLTSDEKLVIVSPDAGGVVRARALAEQLGADLAIIDKRRDGPGQSEAMHVIGDVEGRVAIIIDDIVDSAGTLCQAASALRNAKAKAVHAYGTHGVLSGNAVERVEKSCLESLALTDSIPLSETSQKIRVLSIAPLLSYAITQLHRSEPLMSE